MTEEERRDCDPARFLRASRRYDLRRGARAVAAGLACAVVGSVIVWATTRETSWLAMIAPVGGLVGLLGLVVAVVGVRACLRAARLREEPRLRAAFDAGTAEVWEVGVDMAWDASFESGGDLVCREDARILRATDGSLLYVRSASLQQVARGGSAELPLCPARLVVTRVAGLTTVRADGEPARRMRVAPVAVCMELLELGWDDVRVLTRDDLPVQARAMVEEG